MPSELLAFRAGGSGGKGNAGETSYLVEALTFPVRFIVRNFGEREISAFSLRRFNVIANLAACPARNFHVY